MYSKLCLAYKKLPSELATQTPMQLLALYDPERIQDTLYFETQEDYARWLTSRRSN